MRPHYLLPGSHLPRREILIYSKHYCSSRTNYRQLPTITDNKQSITDNKHTITDNKLTITDNKLKNTDNKQIHTLIVFLYNAIDDSSSYYCQLVVGNCVLVVGNCLLVVGNCRLLTVVVGCCSYHPCQIGCMYPVYFA